jgi:hypothetical protein
MNNNEFRLPRIKILATDSEGLSVSFDEIKWVSNYGKVCIISPANSLVWGRFLSIVERDKTARFIPERKDTISLLHVDDTYIYLDGYWGERAELVFDRKREWVCTTFKSVDAIEFIVDGKRMRSVLGQSPIAGAEDVRRVADGWDHEHCAICWETIGSYECEENTGFKDQNNEWVCKRCYESYVVPKKLTFIEE